MFLCEDINNKPTKYNIHLYIRDKQRNRDIYYKKQQNRFAINKNQLKLELIYIL